MREDLPVWPQDAVPVPIGPSHFHEATIIQNGMIIRRRDTKELHLVMGYEGAIELALLILNAYIGGNDGRTLRADSSSHGMDRDSV